VVRVHLKHWARTTYAHLEWDVTQRRPELRLLMGDTGGWVSVAVHLDRPTLAEAIESMLAPARANAAGSDTRLDMPDHGVAELVALVGPVVAAVVYLCSAEADVIDPDRPWPPVRPRGSGTWASDRA